MPVTTIKLQGNLASKNNMSDLTAKAIEKFESMLRAENCQVINVNMGEEGRTMLGRQQVITVVWTGFSTKIKSSYTAWPNYGLFGGVSSVTLG